MKNDSFVFASDSCRCMVFNMDCITGMRENLRKGSVDVVVTSPPYNLGIGYTRYDDRIPRPEYLKWLCQWAETVKEVLSDEGSIFLNVGSKPSDPWVAFQVLFELRKYFQLQNVIHWIKSIAIQKEDVGNYPGMTGNVTVGHYKPINSARYLNDCHEYIFHLTKRGDVKLDRLAIGVEYQDKSNVTRWHRQSSRRSTILPQTPRDPLRDGARSPAGPRGIPCGTGRDPWRDSAHGDIHCRGNTWFVPYETIRSRDEERPHPATFPVKIPKMCILLHGLEKTRLVLDPFLGIGNTAAACIELGIDFVGFEIDPEYFSESRNALSRASR